MIANLQPAIRARFVRRAFTSLNMVCVSARSALHFGAAARTSTSPGPPYTPRADPSFPPSAENKPVIIFDGYCALCSGWASFVLHHDAAARYRLLSAQSPLGRALYIHYGLDPQDYETNILIAGGGAWFKSEGSIRVAEGLGLPWSLAGVFRGLPMAWRDW